MPKLADIFPSFQFPTREMENWKYTSVRKLLDTEFQVDHVGATGWSPSERPVADQTGRPAGSPYETSIQLSSHPFANLAFTHAEKTNILEITETHSSVISINFTQQKNTATMHHQRIHVAENIHAEILFNHVSEDESTCFTNIFTEIVLEKNAKLSIYKKQTLNSSSFLIDFVFVNQSENSSFNSFTLDQGAALSRTDFSVHLNEAHAEANLNGVYITSNEQVADHHSVIYHHVPHCQSSEHYRGILDDRSKAVFNGKIIIEKDAQKSVTKQLNKNLLLSNQAEIDTKPELEIYADDVKASHGATVGQLDQQALFYLQARGINAEEARALLMQGFLQEVFLSIKNEKIREIFITD